MKYGSGCRYQTGNVHVDYPPNKDEGPQVIMEDYLW